jgi:hypothetical protein
MMFWPKRRITMFYSKVINYGLFKKYLNKIHHIYYSADHVTRFNS